jgi:hypothetical protein
MASTPLKHSPRIADANLEAKEGLRLAGRAAGDCPRSAGSGSPLRIVEQLRELLYRARVPAGDEAHCAAAADVDSGIGGSAPHRLELAIADALQIEIMVLAVEGHQCACDRLLGDAFGISFYRVHREARVRLEQVRHPLVQRALLGQAGGLGDHAEVAVFEVLAHHGVLQRPLRGWMQRAQSLEALLHGSLPV